MVKKTARRTNMNEISNKIMAKLEDIRRATLIGSKDTLTLEECAMVTGYSIQSLYSFTSKRLIPHFKRGNYLFFSKQEIEKWLQSNRVPTVEETSSVGTTYTATGRLRRSK